MANDFSAISPRLLAQALRTLREELSIIPLINRSFSNVPGGQNSTLDIPIPSAIVAQDVAPANTPPTTADVVPTVKTITLDRWKEAAFYLTDLDYTNVMRGIIPMEAAEAVKALGVAMETDVMNEYKNAYNHAGVAGTTPFVTDFSEYLAARKLAGRALMPRSDRFVLLDVDADANAIAKEAFQNSEWRGDTDGIREARIGRKFGADWYSSTLAPYHTSGAATGYLVNGAHSLGAKTIAVNTGTGAYVAGDLITFAGHTQGYTVITAVGGPPNTSITIEPGLVVGVAGGVAITKKASHAVNLLMHRDAVAFGTRPLEDASNMGNIRWETDPVTGISLRLEVTREHKRTRWAFDALWGTDVVRPQWMIRILG